MINDLINNNSIEIYLQPIVSIKGKKIFAYEALTRASDRYLQSISPLYLFEQAKKEKLSLELDTYVREKALIKFSEYYSYDKDLLLFLKFEPSVIESELKDEFIPLVYRYNISPRNIVIEIKEDRIKDTHALKEFIHRYKSHDFLIAIDDFGTNYSSFHRLEFINPDIVKVDRSLIYNVDNNNISSEILSAISRMCHNLGALVIAEGVEAREEVLSCMHKDIDVFLGYWFSRALPEIDGGVLEEIHKRIDNVGHRYEMSIKERIKHKQELVAQSTQIIKEIEELLQKRGMQSIEKIDEVVAKYEKIEAIYLLDSLNGIQIGKTFMRSRSRFLYHPTQEGDDHSLREYYFITKESIRGDYLSPQYLSKASGNVCRTYAHSIDIGRASYIVCCDIVG